MIEKVKEQVIRLLYKPSQDLPADLGTKNHASGPHIQKSNRVMGIQNKK